METFFLSKIEWIKKHKQAELLYQLSNCYFQLNNPKEGRNTLLKGIEQDPSLFDDMQMKYPIIGDEDSKKSKTKKK